MAQYEDALDKLEDMYKEMSEFTNAISAHSVKESRNIKLEDSREAFLMLKIIELETKVEQLENALTSKTRRIKH